MRFVNCHVVETETLNHFSGCADTFYVTADDELFAACLGQPIVTDDHNGVAWCVFNQSGQLFLTPFFVHRSVDWNEVPVVLSMLAHVLDPVFGQTGWTQDQETLGFVVVDHHPDIRQDGGRIVRQVTVRNVIVRPWYVQIEHLACFVGLAAAFNARPDKRGFVQHFLSQRSDRCIGVDSFVNLWDCDGVQEIQQTIY